MQATPKSSAQRLNSSVWMADIIELRFFRLSEAIASGDTGAIAIEY
jgi:hypothetical protein